MCKVRAVGLYTHRILIPYQAMFGSFSVPHLALHLATSLPGRELWMSSSRVHCSIEISVVTLGQITSRALHCLHHFQLVRLCMMETRARHEEPSAEHTVQLSFHLLHLRHDGRNCHTHTPISWLHTSGPRRAEPQPNRTQAVKHSFQDCGSVGHASTTPNMSMSSFPVLSVCGASLPLVHFVSSPPRSRARARPMCVTACRKKVKEMCKMTAQLCSERPMEERRIHATATRVHRVQRSIKVCTSCN